MSTLTLLKWKGPHGREQKFRLITRVSAKWLDFGYRLQRDTNQLEGWERECLLNADRCWCKVMGYWLKENGTLHYPTTWKGIFRLLEDVECLEVAQDLQKALDSVIQPPPPPPLPPDVLYDTGIPEESTSPIPASDTAEYIPSADTAESIPAADTAESIPAADTAESIPAADTAESIPAADTAESIPAADTAESIPAADTAESIPAADTAETIPAADTAEMITDTTLPATDTTEITALPAESIPAADTVEDQDAAELYSFLLLSS